MKELAFGGLLLSPLVLLIWQPHPPSGIGTSPSHWLPLAQKLSLLPLIPYTSQLVCAWCPILSGPLSSTVATCLVLTVTIASLQELIAILWEVPSEVPGFHGQK